METRDLIAQNVASVAFFTTDSSFFSAPDDFVIVPDDGLDFPGEEAVVAFSTFSSFFDVFFSSESLLVATDGLIDFFALSDEKYRLPVMIGRMSKEENVEVDDKASDVME